MTQQLGQKDCRVNGIRGEERKKGKQKKEKMKLSRKIKSK